MPAIGSAALSIEAACRSRHPITKLLPGRLGLALTSAAQGVAGSSSGQEAAQDAAAVATAVCSDGAVQLVQVLEGVAQVGSGSSSSGSGNSAGAVLLQSQVQLEAVQREVQVGLALAAPHASSWQLCVPWARGLPGGVLAAGGPEQEQGGANELPCHAVDCQFLRCGAGSGGEAGPGWPLIQQAVREAAVGLATAALQ
jgi:hypothetical protein